MWLLGVVRNTTEGNWVRVNQNAFADVWAPEELRPLDGLTNAPPSKIIEAWSSFAWDSNRGDLILYGGGHANYSGNDVYRWRGTSGLWERASLPSEIAQDGLGNWTAIDGPDAAPSSAHTYDNSVFLPVVDRFVTFGGAAYNNGGPYFRQVDAVTSRRTGPYFFDPSRADPNKVGGTTGSHVKRVAPHPEVLGGDMWENRDIHVNIPGNPVLPGHHISGATAYATENGKDVVYIGASMGYGTDMQIFRYVVNDIADPSADTCEWVGLYWSRTGGMGTGAYDPGQKLFLATGDGAVPFWYHDLNTPGPDNKDVGVVPADPGGAFAAATASNGIAFFGMDFDPVRRRYLLWGGGASVWSLSPPATISPSGWAIAKAPLPSSAVPSTDVGTGVLGKWKYVPNLDAFMALTDRVQGEVWIYKPVGWQDPAPPNSPPTVVLTAPFQGQSFAAPAHVQLAATASDADGTVTRVEFFQGAVKLGEATAPPYVYDWNGAPAGSFLLTARATDNAGATTASSAVAVTIGTVPAALQFALFRPSNNKFLVDHDFDHTPDLKQAFGASGDVGLAGRIDADALADFVLYRNGQWFADTNRDGTAEFFANFGGAPGDVPRLADFDGDGREDLVVYRSGMWYVSTTRTGTANYAFGFGGVPGDVPLAGDVNGDGLADLVIYRNGSWYVDTNRDGTADIVAGFGGVPGDLPILFDWDGDGRADLCVFRNGVWYVNTRLDGTAQVIFGYGATGDVPLTGRFK